MSNKNKQVTNVDSEEPIKFGGEGKITDGKLQLTLEDRGDLSERLKEIFGTSHRAALDLLIFQLGRVVDPENKDVATSLNRITPILRAIGPQDALEGTLALQMVAIHCMAMEMMGRAMQGDQTAEGVNNNVSRVTKLTRTFLAQMDALNKHRGKGQQKITVEHVTVNEGGQAIVGNVEQGGRDENKK